MNAILAYIKDRLLLTSLRETLSGRAKPCAVCAVQREQVERLNAVLALERKARDMEQKRGDEYRLEMVKAIELIGQEEKKLADTQGLLSEQIKRADGLSRLVSQLAGATRAPFEARESDSPPPFDEDDRTRWREFLATPTGRRLAQGLNYWAQSKEQQATIATANQVYHCGQAAGFRAFGVWALHSLSADTRLQQGEDTRAQNGASDLRERIAP